MDDTDLSSERVEMGWIAMRGAIKKRRESFGKGGINLATLREKGELGAEKIQKGKGNFTQTARFSPKSEKGGEGVSKKRA